MKILYEGADIYPDVSVHRCYHDMYAEKQSDELLLKLNDTRELWDSWNPKKGDTIAIEDGAAKTGKMFVESVVPESGIITLRAYSVPQSAKDKRSKSWEKVKFLQLAQEIAGRHGLTLETYGITDQTYDYVEQNNLADFAFFKTAAPSRARRFWCMTASWSSTTRRTWKASSPSTPSPSPRPMTSSTATRAPTPTARPKPSTAA